MKILILSLTAVFGIVLFGLVDSIYADHPATLDSEIIYDIRINNCTSFTIFGNTDEISPIYYDISFYEYLDENRYYRYNSYENHKFPNNDGSFEHTITVNSTYNFTEYDFIDEPYRDNSGKWELDSSYNSRPTTDLYQGYILIGLEQSAYKPHRSNWIHYHIEPSYRNHTHHDNATEHTHAYNNPTTDFHEINVRTNPDTNQLCFYETEYVCNIDGDDHSEHIYNPGNPILACNYIEIEQASPIQEPTISKTTLQIANENIERLEEKKERKTELKNIWKERFQVCKDERKDLKTDNKSLKSKFNTMESLYNTTETERSELEILYTELDLEYDRVRQELTDLQSTHNSTLTELNKLRERIQELES